MISSLITQIVNKEIVLPPIQSDFVWSESRITMMFDSIMRGYPLGMSRVNTIPHYLARQGNLDSPPLRRLG